MIYGKIDYLNLLPFHTFIKRYMKSSHLNAIAEYKKGVPTKINKTFKKRNVDVAFISSIVAKKYRHLNVGIVAKKEVLSVLVLPNKKDKKDIASATSNILAQKLNIKGEVIIGNKALKYQLRFGNGIDLAKVWYDKYNLPFVFAQLSYHKKATYLKKLSRNFLKSKVKIPQYIIKKESIKTGISVNDIHFYLGKIFYKVDNLAQKALKKFYK